MIEQHDVNELNLVNLEKVMKYLPIPQIDYFYIKRCDAQMCLE